MDTNKLLAVLPETDGGQIIMTIVPTIHFDAIPTTEGKKRADYLTDRGIPKL